MAATISQRPPVQGQPKPWLRFALIALAVLIALAFAIWGVRSLMSDKPKARSQPKLTLIPDKPPPPPPPPKEEKKPEPPKEQKEMKVDEIKQTPQPPDDPTLKMEGAAGEGQSLFSSGTVTNENFRMGTGGAGAFAAYGSAIKIELQRFLAKRSELKRRQYKVDVNVWMANDGRMTRYELIGTTTDADLDESLRNALAAFPSFSSTPPEGLPQPVRLRITASGRT